MTHLILAIPLALLFMTLSDQWSFGGLAVGYVVGLAVMVLIGAGNMRLKLLRLPVQLFWALVYGVGLFIDIFLSSIDVTRRVLHPDLPIKPGEIRVPTQDKHRDLITSAMSAHSITVTPGEMVVGFEDDGDEIVMVVHTLDVDASGANAAEEQRSRLQRIARITRRTA
ncbi:MAG: Na+/H+ antiporter subunit E [Chloroflexota bacterium]